MTNIKETVFLSLYIWVMQRHPNLVLTFHVRWYKYPQFNLLPTDDISNTITAVSKRESRCLPEAQRIIIPFHLSSGQRYNQKTRVMIKLDQLNHFKSHLSSFLSQLWASAELATWTFIGFIAVGGKIT